MTGKDILRGIYATEYIQRNKNGPGIYIEIFFVLLMDDSCLFGQQLPTCRKLAPKVKSLFFTKGKQSGTNWAGQKNRVVFTATLVPTYCPEPLNWPHRGPLNRVSIPVNTSGAVGFSPVLQGNPSVKLIRFFFPKNIQAIDLRIENSIDV